uniref:Vesicle-associated membrane protein 2 n=1 Tax=Caligus rogercresseyi TaxID=217165 RepID=C1BMH0_CALRO|nr:Vesicle-associated membrane protein 2 [Caligus rogercresseyi]|eukprot:TRINITY_DN6202_c0_g1_i1.p1 TRINITY_DN6202_c0_g1~~TRINITY_DN6202_c0_g1_i1.p1  ORF type:complete len:120 (-),score=24.91 TRINITY_DN6202_c0_g1_i1:31-390(-)
MEFKDDPRDNPSSFQSTKRQVDEVVNIMRDNINKVIERDQKLESLDTRAANLQENSNAFATTSIRLRRKYWWQNLKMKIIIGVIILLVAFFISLTLYLEYGGSDEPHVNATSIQPTVEE